jgi:hypothetical protein
MSESARRYRAKIAHDIETMLHTHRDDGNGRCAAGCLAPAGSYHEYPCDVRLWYEWASHLLDKRRRLKRTRAVPGPARRGT